MPLSAYKPQITTYVYDESGSRITATETTGHSTLDEARSAYDANRALIAKPDAPATDLHLELVAPDGSTVVWAASNNFSTDELAVVRAMESTLVDDAKGPTVAAIEASSDTCASIYAYTLKHPKLHAEVGPLESPDATQLDELIKTFADWANDVVSDGAMLQLEC